MGSLDDYEHNYLPITARTPQWRLSMDEMKVEWVLAKDVHDEGGLVEPKSVHAVPVVRLDAVQAALRAKDLELTAARNAAIKEGIRYGELQRQIDTLIAEAVWAMSEIMWIQHMDKGSMLYRRAQSFLASPTVAAFRARQKEKKNGY